MCKDDLVFCVTYAYAFLFAKGNHTSYTTTAGEESDLLSVSLSLDRTRLIVLLVLWSWIHSSLSSECVCDIDESTVVDDSLLCATADLFLLFLFLDLWCLRLYFACSCERSVNFALEY